MSRLIHFTIVAAVLLMPALHVRAEDSIYRNPVIDQSLPDRNHPK